MTFVAPWRQADRMHQGEKRFEWPNYAEPASRIMKQNSHEL